MGARQSKRSVDITTTPKKGEAEVIAEGEGKLEKIGDADIKTTTNGAVPHIEVVEKDENAKDAAAEKETKEEVIENGLLESEDAKTPEGEQSQENLSEPTVIAEKTPDSGNDSKIEDTPETKKQKEKSKKKKWSFRSISFSKKDKQKPSKDSDKNGDVKEVAEENVEENATSPSIESPNSEEAKSTEAVSKGEAAVEDIVKPVDAPEEVPKASEEAIPEEPTGTAVEEPKVPEPVVEKPAESAPSPAKEQKEPQPVEPPTPAVEETKEVRNEEVPPPLPSSNPPSPVTVFAESTKADALTADQVPVLESPMVRSIVESPPLAASSPVTKSVSESVPVVDTPEESVPQQVPETQLIDSDITLPKESVTRETEIEIKDPDTVPSSAQDEFKEPESITETPPKTPELEPDVQKPNEIRSTLPLEKKSELPLENVDQISTEVSKSNEIHDSGSTEATISPTEQESNETLTEAAADQNKNESLPEANPSDTVNESITEPSAVTPKVVSENCEAPTKSSESEEGKPHEVSEVISEITTASVEPLHSSEPLGEISESPKEFEELKTLETPKEICESTPASLETVPSSEPIDKTSVSPIESVEPPILENPGSINEPSLAPVEPSSTPKSPVSLEQPENPPDLDQPSSPIALPVSPPQSPAVVPGCGDSFPDSSTESLPSLPEPASDLEPMSLPPVESVPEPIATDCTACELPPPSDSPVLTNGSVNGLPPTGEEVTALPSREGPLKQVLAEPTSEVRQEVEEKKDEDTAVESAAAVEE